MGPAKNSFLSRRCWTLQPCHSLILNVRLTFGLKLISSQIGVAMLQLYGMSAYREGNIIDLGFYSVAGGRGMQRSSVPDAPPSTELDPLLLVQGPRMEENLPDPLLYSYRNFRQQLSHRGNRRPLQHVGRPGRRVSSTALPVG